MCLCLRERKKKEYCGRGTDWQEDVLCVREREREGVCVSGGDIDRKLIFLCARQQTA